MNHKIILLLKFKIEEFQALDYDNWENIIDLLKDEYSDYRIIDSHGTLIKNFKYSKIDYSEILGYTIHFKEKISDDHLEEFIMNSDNDYQVTRIRDYKILKEFKPIIKEKGIQKIKKYFKG